MCTSHFVLHCICNSTDLPSAKASLMHIIRAQGEYMFVMLFLTTFVPQVVFLPSLPTTLSFNFFLQDSNMPESVMHYLLIKGYVIFYMQDAV